MSAWEKIVSMATTAYDEIPYANLPFAQTRPAVLATVATLHGLTPPDPREARVLELGCGAGANLAGIAAADPGVRAVGVDLAPTAVEVAQATAAAAGLDNVTFDVGDVLALDRGGARRVRLRDRPRALRVGAGARARGGARVVPQPPLAGRDRLPLLHRASGRPHAPDAARDGPVARARAGRAARARRAGARAVHAARPARRVGGAVVLLRRRGGGRARARRPRPTRCSCTTCSARPTRRSGSRSSPRRSPATGWPTSGTRRRRAAASRRGRPPSPPSSRRRPATTASRASSTSTCS